MTVSLKRGINNGKAVEIWDWAAHFMSFFHSNSFVWPYNAKEQSKAMFIFLF